MSNKTNASRSVSPNFKDLALRTQKSVSPFNNQQLNSKEFKHLNINKEIFYPKIQKVSSDTYWDN